MKQFLVLAYACICFAFMQSTLQGEYDQFHVNRKLQTFNQLELSFPAEYVIHAGEDERLQFDADANAIEGIDVAIEGGKLTISEAQDLFDTIKAYKKNQIHIHVKSLRSIVGIGNVDVSILNVLKGDYLFIKLAQKSRLKGEIDYKKITVDLLGKSQLELSGEVEDQSVIVDGPGMYDGHKLISQNCDLRVYGLGNVDINVKKELDVIVGGSGQVRYHGQVPKKLNKKIRSGSVKHVEP